LASIAQRVLANCRSGLGLSRANPFSTAIDRAEQ